MDKWQNYFLASAGAAAALTGLIFVGVSINLKKILSFRQLPNRALGTLILLTNILLVSSFCLIPDQSLFSLGMEVLILSLVIWIFNTRMDIHTIREKDNKYWIQNLQNLVFNQFAIGPFFVSSVLLLQSNPLGLSWLVPGIAMSFVKAIVDAWVLLLEIHR